MTPTIPAPCLTARHACEALAARLRTGKDATLETADACAALRALADAWALVLPRLPADVTPPEWPAWGPLGLGGRVIGRMSPGGIAAFADRWQRVECTDPEVAARYLDAYADGLRTWGREAAACEEEAEPANEACPSCSGKGYPRATGPGCACAACRGTGVKRTAEGAPSLAFVAAAMLAGEMACHVVDEPDPDSAPYTLSALASTPVEAARPVGHACANAAAPCGHSGHGVCSDCGWLP